MLLPPISTISQDQLWDLLCMPVDIEVEDMEHIEARKDQIPLRERSRAQQIAQNELFQEWAITARSSRLLIHGNYFGPAPGMVGQAALSFFTTFVAKAFRARPNFICLVWFCGRHVEEEDDEDDGYEDFSDSETESDEYYSTYRSGAFYDDEEDEETDIYREHAYTQKGPIKKMLRSLIAQLLSDHDFALRTRALPPGLSASALLNQGGLSFKQLITIFRWLVRQLPPEITLFCIIDGIIVYEREELEDATLEALGDILDLTVDKDPSVPSAPVKVLVTSQRPTSSVRIAFEKHYEGEPVPLAGEGETDEDIHNVLDKDWILSMDALPPLPWSGPSEARMNRELGVHGDEE